MKRHLVKSVKRHVDQNVKRHSIKGVKRLAIIIPTLNEGAVIVPLLRMLSPLREQGHEIIVSDGGSTDETCALAEPWVDHLVQGKPGRARQMNAGAAVAQSDWLWFVHADTGLLAPVEDYAQAIIASSRAWGRFDVALDADATIYRVIAKLMNQRSRWSGIATGDQGLFVQRVLFQRLAGFAAIPLMEDIEISRRLKAICRPNSRRLRLLTSARRWQHQGVLRTVLLMWRLRLAYFLGVSPERLQRHYRACSSPQGSATVSDSIAPHSH